MKVQDFIYRLRNILDLINVLIDAFFTAAKLYIIIKSLLFIISVYDKIRDKFSLLIKWLL